MHRLSSPIATPSSPGLDTNHNSPTDAAGAQRKPNPAGRTQYSSSGLPTYLTWQAVSWTTREKQGLLHTCFQQYDAAPVTQIRGKGSTL